MQQFVKEKIVAVVEFVAQVLNSPQPSTCALAGSNDRSRCFDRTKSYEMKLILPAETP